MHQEADDDVTSCAFNIQPVCLYLPLHMLLGKQNASPPPPDTLCTWVLSIITRQRRKFLDTLLHSTPSCNRRRFDTTNLKKWLTNDQ